METIQLIEEFLLPHYVKKDIMHNFDHIKKILNLALDMSKKYKDKIDKDLLIFGSYLHGVIYKENIRTENWV